MKARYQGDSGWLWAQHVGPELRFALSKGRGYVGLDGIYPDLGPEKWAELALYCAKDAQRLDDGEPIAVTGTMGPDGLHLWFLGDLVAGGLVGEDWVQAPEYNGSEITGDEPWWLRMVLRAAGMHKGQANWLRVPGATAAVVCLPGLRGVYAGLESNLLRQTMSEGKTVDAGDPTWAPASMLVIRGRR